MSDANADFCNLAERGLVAASAAAYIVVMMSVRRFTRAVAVLPIRAYQIIVSPFFPASCRYFPTCSSYAREAITRHGVLAGLVLGLARILRCSRFFSGGFDPVPEQFSLKVVGSGYRAFRSRRAYGPEDGGNAE